MLIQAMPAGLSFVMRAFVKRACRAGHSALADRAWALAEKHRT
jgi:hypothetical protein